MNGSAMNPTNKSSAIPKVIDVKTFWNAIGVRAIGVAVVTAVDEHGPSGFLALSVAHLSADPPTMMIGIGLKTSALATIQRSKHFAINYLTKEQTDLADLFGGRLAKKGAERFFGSKWGTMATGAPVLLDGVGALDCQLEETIERYSTVIAIGRLVDFVFYSGRQPLVSFAGSYSELSSTNLNRTAMSK
jgi:flavin reductase (DIM6/NTAB) family NADH-FMN oxidoreductase RutF